MPASKSNKSSSIKSSSIKGGGGAGDDNTTGPTIKNNSNSGGGKKRRVAIHPDGDGDGISSTTINNSSSSSSSGIRSSTTTFEAGNVTIEQLQAATGMSAEAAEAYLEAAESQRNSSGSGNRSGSGSGSSGPSKSTPADVKISFGPSRPPSSRKNNSSSIRGGGGGGDGGGMTAASATIGLATRSGGSGSEGGGSSSSDLFTTSLGEIDLEALKERAAAVIASSTASGGAGGGGGSGSGSSGGGFTAGKQGLPCSEAEMKALMGMFVEIMGMSMKNGGPGNGGTGGGNDTGKGPFFNVSTTNSSDPTTPGNSSNSNSNASFPMTNEQMASLFSDGETWEALRRTYAAAGQMTGSAPPPDYDYPYDHEDLFDHDGDEDYEDSLDGEPNRELTFEEVEFLLQRRRQQADTTNLSKQFSAGDWESLEQGAAGEYTVQLDDRERKAVKKRDKKQQKKLRLKEEAARRAAAEEAQKKQEKAIASWRSRVVSACQSNESQKLESLLQESPLRIPPEEDNLKDEYSRRWRLNSSAQFSTHLEFLLPNIVPKNRQHVGRGVESRMLLADFVLEMDLPLALKPMRTGRSALHMSCFLGDVQFLKLLFEKIKDYHPTNGQLGIPPNFIDTTCEESGWSPLHYAALSGSTEVLELLLEKGPNLRKITDATHTWRDSDGLGITPRELVEYVIAGKQDKEIETHGVALLDVKNSFFGQMQEKRLFLRNLERVQQRLAAIEKNGYSPPALVENTDDSEDVRNDSTADSAEVATSQSKKRSKKKKKKKKNEKEVQSENQSTQGTREASEIHAAPVAESAEKIDPLVAALQGMGFGDNQIEAAVKACGGTHRATADDLVTWILTQDTGDDNQTNEPAASTPSHIDQKNEVQWEQVSKDVDSEITDLTSEKEKMERQAKDQQEEAARRLAAKREEKRRRNREWNNREQARQAQEAKAKVAQKAISAIQQSAVAAPPPPSNALHNVAPPGTGEANRPYSIPVPQSAQAIRTHSLGSQVRPQMQSTDIPATDMAGTTMWEALKPPPMPSRPSSHPAVPASHHHQNQFQTGFVSFSQNNDDDRTVSSFGSNRGLSVSSKEFVPGSFTANSPAPVPPVPPPGFNTSHSSVSSLTMPPRPVATVPEKSSSVSFVEDSQKGEIRATARAFVPSGYSKQTAPTPQQDFGLPGSSFLSERRPLPQQQEGMGTSNLPLSQPSNPTTTDVSSLLGVGFSGSLDNTAPSTTPVSEDSTAPGTSLAGLVSSEQRSDDLPMSIALGDLGTTNIDHAIHGSSIGGSNLLGAISRGSSTGGTSIWGGTPDDTAPSLQNSLQASFFGGDGAFDNTRSDDNNKGLSWNPTSDLTGNRESQAGGSIW